MKNPSFFDHIQDYLDEVLIPCCIFCDHPKEYVCNSCLNVFFEGNSEHLVLSGINHTKICFVYNRAVEYLWEQTKHQGYYRIARCVGNLAARYLLESLSEEYGLSPPRSQTVYFVPVPISQRKVGSRGFNQVVEMFYGMDTILSEQGVSCELLEILERKRDTKTQIGQNREGRKHNLTGAFCLNETAQVLLSRDKSYFYKKDLVILDDICTTGSTLEECAQVLSELKPRSIKAIVFAKG